MTNVWIAAPALSLAVLASPAMAQDHSAHQHDQAPATQQPAPVQPPQQHQHDTRPQRNPCRSISTMRRAATCA
jgi:hypothetical protein